MSRSIWLVSKLSPETIARGFKAFRMVAQTGCSYEQGLGFVGYYLERCRQASSSLTSATAMLAGANRSKWRFLGGKNAANYRDVGKRVLESCWEQLGCAGPAGATPALVLWDLLVDANPAEVAPKPTAPTLKWKRSVEGRRVYPEGSNTVFKTMLYTSTCGHYRIKGSHSSYRLDAGSQTILGPQYGFYLTLRAAKEAAEAHHRARHG